MFLEHLPGTKKALNKYLPDDPSINESTINNILTTNTVTHFIGQFFSFFKKMYVFI